MDDEPLEEIGAQCEQVPFAINEGGRVVHAAEPSVVRGKKCNCTCPNCQKPLVAKKGRVKAPHFAHFRGTACRGARETALHKAAKQILEDASYLQLPALTITPIRGQSWQLWLEGSFSYDTVRSEVTIESFRPDIVISGPRGQILVEVYVTHPCSEKKIAWVRSSARMMVEIDLHKLPWLPTWDQLRTLVLTTTDNKRWVNEPGCTELVDKVSTSLCSPKSPPGLRLTTIVACPLGDLSGWRNVPIAQACDYCSFRASEWLVEQAGHDDQDGVWCLAHTGISCGADYRETRDAGWVFRRHTRGLPEEFRVPPPPVVPPAPVDLIEEAVQPPPAPVLPLPPKVPKAPEGADVEEWTRQYLAMLDEGRHPEEAEAWMRALKKYRPKVHVQQDLFAAVRTCPACGAPLRSITSRANGDCLWACTADSRHQRTWAPP